MVQPAFTRRRAGISAWMGGRSPFMKTLRTILMLVVLSASAYAGFDSLYVTTHGDTATIWHKNTVSNCASKFVFDVTVNHDTIVIVERDTVGPRANCICTFDLNVTVVNLLGNFVAMVYRQQLKIYDYPKDTVYLVGSTSFSISSLNMLPYFSITGFQSGCNGVPVTVERKSVFSPQISRVINHPNPFNSSTNFRFNVSSSQFVSLKIFDLLGREAATLINGDLNPGEHFAQWNAADFPSGIYFYRMTVGNVVQVGKMNYVR
jgi:hypothetical protein